MHRHINCELFLNFMSVCDVSQEKITNGNNLTSCGSFKAKKVKKLSYSPKKEKISRRKEKTRYAYQKEENWQPFLKKVRGARENMKIQKTEVVEISEGAQEAKLISLTDKEFKNEDGSKSERISWNFEVTGTKGEKAMVSGLTSRIFNEKSKIYKWISNLKPSLLKDQELDTDLLIGSKCLVNIEHNKKDFAFVESVMKKGGK